MIICIEGADGIGKSTQVKLLAKRLDADIIKYPFYNSITGNLISDILLNNPLKDLSNKKRALIIQSLMTLNRYEIVEKVKECNKDNIIFDRYVLSGYVYGTMDGLTEEFIKSINSSLPEPDLTIVMYGTPYRLNDDYYEKEAKQERVNMLYQSYARQFKYPLVNANQDIDDVSYDIMNYILMHKGNIIEIIGD